MREIAVVLKICATETAALTRRDINDRNYTKIRTVIKRRALLAGYKGSTNEESYRLKACAPPLERVRGNARGN